MPNSLTVFGTSVGDVSIGGSRGVWTNAGAPTSGAAGTYYNQASPGDLLIDTTNKILYQNTNTLASPTWTQRNGSGAAFAGTFDGVLGGTTPAAATVTTLTASGLSKWAAAGAISAAGTSSQSGATPLTKDFNQVGTVAANAGVALPAALAGRRIIVANYGANTLKIWPINGGTDIIDALSANTNTTLSAANRIATFFCFVDGTWVSSLGGAVSA